MESEVIVALITGVFGVITGIITTRKKQEKKEKVNIEENLQNHHFFSRMDFLIDDVNRSFSLGNKGKEIIFKDIISNQLIIFQTELKMLAEKIDKNEIKDTNELYNINYSIFNKILNSTHNYYKFNSKYTVEEQRALDIVMKKYECWGEGRLNSLSESILMSCNSPFYSNIKVRGAVILDTYLSVAVDTINNAEKTLTYINGDLKGLHFKGVIV